MKVYCILYVCIPNAFSSIFDSYFVLLNFVIAPRVVIDVVLVLLLLCVLAKRKATRSLSVQCLLFVDCLMRIERRKKNHLI